MRVRHFACFEVGSGGVECGSLSDPSQEDPDAEISDLAEVGIEEVVVTESLLAFAPPGPLSHGIFPMRIPLSSSSLSEASSDSGRLDFDTGGGGMGKLRYGPPSFIRQETKASWGVDSHITCRNR
jgi:hypothetical protein